MPKQLVLGLLIAGMLVSLGWLVHPWYDVSNDGSIYIVAARSLAAGEGYTYLGAPFHLRPPGFSLLIAPVLAAWGTSFFALNLYVSLWGVATVALLYVYQRPKLGTTLALCACVVVWLNPGFRMFSTQVMSDVPGAALLLACLLIDRWAARAPSARRNVLLGVAIGLATYVRTINILLLPAIVAARLADRLTGPERTESWKLESWKPWAVRCAVLVAVAWLVLLPWGVRNHFRAPPPPADQTLMYSYSTAWLHTDPGDPASPRYSAGQLLERIPQRSENIAAALLGRLHGAGQGLPAILAVPLLAGWLWVLAKRRSASEFFVGAALVVVGTYFAYQDRLFLPIYLLVFCCAIEALRDLLRVALDPRAATWIVAAGLLLLAVVDFDPRPNWEGIEQQHRARVATAEAIAGAVPSEATLAAETGWHLNVYLERPVYGLKHAIWRAQRVDAAVAIIDRYDVDVVVLNNLQAQDRALLQYFLARYPGPRTVGPLLFFEIRPTPGDGSSHDTGGRPSMRGHRS